MKFKELIGLVTAILVLFGMLFGTYQFMENRYASADDVKKATKDTKKVEKRLDYKILSDQYRDIQRQIWDIKKEFRGKKMDETNKQTIENLEMEKQEVKDKMDVLRKEAVN